MMVEKGIAELPKGWVKVRLNDICEKITDGTHFTPTYISSGISFISVKDIYAGKIHFDNCKFISEAEHNSLIKRCNPEYLDILITKSGTIGRIAVVQTSKAFSLFVSVALIKPFKGYMNSYFIAFALNDFINNIDIKQSVKGGVIKNLHIEDIKEIIIAVPPLTEQHRIVAKIEQLFSDLDAGVEALKKAKAQLKLYRQTVLKAAFEGRLTAVWREANEGESEPANVLLERIKKRIKEIGINKGKDLPPIDKSYLAKLPQKWAWTRIGEISDKIHYGYTESSTTEPIGPKFLRITDIQDNSVNWDSVPYCPIKDNEKQKYLLKKGDLVFARTGATVGKSFLIKGDIPPAVFASYLIRIILNELINRKYVYNYFQSLSYWEQIHEKKLGIGQPNVNGQILAQIIMPLPPIPEQERITQEIERCFSLADAVDEALNNGLIQSDRLRQSILKKAFAGELVPQDPEDEPAAELLERIKAERAVNATKKKPGRKPVQKDLNYG